MAFKPKRARHNYEWLGALLAGGMRLSCATSP